MTNLEWTIEPDKGFDKRSNGGSANPKHSSESSTPKNSRGRENPYSKIAHKNFIAEALTKLLDSEKIDYRTRFAIWKNLILVAEEMSSLSGTKLKEYKPDFSIPGLSRKQRSHIKDLIEGIKYYPEETLRLLVSNSSLGVLDPNINLADNDLTQLSSDEEDKEFLNQLPKKYLDSMPGFMPEYTLNLGGKDEEGNPTKLTPTVIVNSDTMGIVSAAVIRQEVIKPLLERNNPFTTMDDDAFYNVALLCKMHGLLDGTNASSKFIQSLVHKRARDLSGELPLFLARTQDQMELENKEDIVELLKDLSKSFKKIVIQEEVIRDAQFEAIKALASQHSGRAQHLPIEKQPDPIAAKRAETRGEASGHQYRTSYSKLLITLIEKISLKERQEAKIYTNTLVQQLRTNRHISKRIAELFNKCMSSAQHSTENLEEQEHLFISKIKEEQPLFIEPFSSILNSTDDTMSTTAIALLLIQANFTSSEELDREFIATFNSYAENRIDQLKEYSIISLDPRLLLEITNDLSTKNLSIKDSSHPPEYWSKEHGITSITTTEEVEVSKLIQLFSQFGEYLMSSSFSLTQVIILATTVPLTNHQVREKLFEFLSLLPNTTTNHWVVASLQSFLAAPEKYHIVSIAYAVSICINMASTIIHARKISGPKGYQKIAEFFGSIAELERLSRKKTNQLLLRIVLATVLLGATGIEVDKNREIISDYAHRISATIEDEIDWYIQSVSSEEDTGEKPASLGNREIKKAGEPKWEVYPPLTERELAVGALYGYSEGGELVEYTLGNRVYDYSRSSLELPIFPYPDDYSTKEVYEVETGLEYRQGDENTDTLMLRFKPGDARKEMPNVTGYALEAVYISQNDFDRLGKKLNPSEFNLTIDHSPFSSFKLNLPLRLRHDLILRYHKLGSLRDEDNSNARITVGRYMYSPTVDLRTMRREPQDSEQWLTQRTEVIPEAVGLMTYPPEVIDNLRNGKKQYVIVNDVDKATESFQLEDYDFAQVYLNTTGGNVSVGLLANKNPQFDLSEIYQNPHLTENPELPVLKAAATWLSSAKFYYQVGGGRYDRAFIVFSEPPPVGIYDINIEYQHLTWWTFQDTYLSQTNSESIHPSMNPSEPEVFPWTQYPYFPLDAKLSNGNFALQNYLRSTGLDSLTPGEGLFEAYLERADHPEELTWITDVIVNIQENDTRTAQTEKLSYILEELKKRGLVYDWGEDANIHSFENTMDLLRVDPDTGMLKNPNQVCGTMSAMVYNLAYLSGIGSDSFLMRANVQSPQMPYGGNLSSSHMVIVYRETSDYASDWYENFLIFDATLPVESKVDNYPRLDANINYQELEKQQREDLISSLVKIFGLSATGLATFGLYNNKEGLKKKLSKVVGGTNAKADHLLDRRRRRIIRKLKAMPGVSLLFLGTIFTYSSPDHPIVAYSKLHSDYLNNDNNEIPEEEIKIIVLDEIIPHGLKGVVGDVIYGITGNHPDIEYGGYYSEEGGVNRVIQNLDKRINKPPKSAKRILNSLRNTFRRSINHQNSDSYTDFQRVTSIIYKLLDTEKEPMRSLIDKEVQYVLKNRTLLNKVERLVIKDRQRQQPAISRYLKKNNSDISYAEVHLKLVKLIAHRIEEVRRVLRLI